jgi:nitroreductase
MIELIRKRRSVRLYAEKPVEKKVVDVLVETLLRAPTSRNNRPWEFVVVDDRETLERLAGAKESGSQFLKGAALAIVICADPEKSDVWVEDCSIAAILVQMVAQSVSLGSCWIQIRNRKQSDAMTSERYVRKVLGIPNQLKVEAIVSIGWPAEKKKTIAKSSLDFDKVSRNRYSIPFAVKNL